eukprot:6465219-Amphidinium_carterae.1
MPLPCYEASALTAALEFRSLAGGWGYVMQFGGEERQESGFLRDTTNNAMELTATIRGLQMCQQLGRGCTVEVLMDSKYVIEGATKWIKTWKRNNWLTVKRTPVLNRELWVQLDALMGPHVRLEWVKGHGSCDLHNRADALARAAYRYDDNDDDEDDDGDGVIMA